MAGRVIGHGSGGQDSSGAGPAVLPPPDLSMIGSTLLGGATCDLSARERQPYIDGVSVRARVRLVGWLPDTCAWLVQLRSHRRVRGDRISHDCVCASTRCR